MFNRAKCVHLKWNVRAAIAVSITLSAGASELKAGLTSQVVNQQTRPVEIGVCEREAAGIVKREPARIGGSIRPPKKTRDVSPVYPDLPTGTTGSGMWVGEILVDATGKVSRVWSIREVTLKPAFLAFNAAIVSAIQQWEFEPLIVSGKRMPFCMKVTTSINWK